MTNRDKGIRAIIPGIVFAEEEAQDQKEKQAAKEYIHQKLGAPLELQAAEDRYITPIPETKFEPTFYQPTKTKEQLKEEKFKKDFEKEYGHEAIKKDILKNINANKRAGKRDYEGFSSSDIIVAEDIKEKAKARLKHFQSNKLAEKETPRETWDRLEKEQNKPTGYPKNKKNFLKGGITVDPNHPDGFRINDDTDLYEVYGNTDEVRYIQEMKYKYDGIPIKNSIKPFDQFNKSTYPSDPAQQTALRSYEKLYNRLTPLQKKQIENSNKKNKPFTTIANNLGKK